MTELIRKIKTLIYSLPLFLFSLPIYAHYAIYIDAGSSGSRLYLYQYENTKPLATINTVFSKKVTPGLSSFQNSPEKANISMKELLDSVTGLLKNINLQAIPVNILSTGGMRLLTIENQTKIYTSLKNFIKKNYPFTIGEIKTISGEKEGLFGWLAVNYLTETLQKGQPTFGSIDMGNASTQITFVIEDPNTKKNNPFADLKINKKDFHIVSKSFLGLGLREARKTIASCYPKNYTINEKLAGDFNFKNCSDLYLQFIDSYKISTELHFPKKMQFIAYSGIYGPLHFFSTESNPEKHTIEDAIQTICDTPWHEFMKTYSQKNTTYLPYYCSDATYISNLLFEGYQLSGQQLLVTKEIKGNKVAWTLGALLYNLVSDTQ
ncbi:MAG: hypothetical protein V4471_01800 [Pseudomonadota bacterium]